MIVVEVLFWVSLALLVWTHAAYPLVARAFARIRTRQVRRDDSRLPTVAVVIAAYN